MIASQQVNPVDFVRELEKFDLKEDKIAVAGVKEIEHSIRDLISLTRKRQQFIAFANVNESVCSTLGDSYIDKKLVPQL